MLDRRQFTFGLIATLASPAIVRAASIWIPPKKSLVFLPIDSTSLPIASIGTYMFFFADGSWEEGRIKDGEYIPSANSPSPISLIS